MTTKILEEKHFIEDVGLFFEQMGVPRMGGRVLGVLLISDPPAQSINDLCEVLQASKSAISTSTRYLTGIGLIEKVASPIPRRDYYRFKSGGWFLYMKQWLTLMSDLHKVTERGLELISDKPDDLKERLLEAHDVFSFLEDHFPAILGNLQKERKIKTISK